VRRCLLAAALVLTTAANASAGGWYLIWPYEEGETGRFTLNLPLSQWYTDGVFDTAKECKAAREAAIDNEAKSWCAPPGTFDDPTLAADYKRNCDLFTRWVGFSRCVASDDPRLGPVR
jgi:hypothetical protein